MIICDTCKLVLSNEAKVGLFVQMSVWTFYPLTFAYHVKGGRELESGETVFEDRELILCPSCRSDFATKLRDLVLAFKPAGMTSS